MLGNLYFAKWKHTIFPLRYIYIFFIRLSKMNIKNYYVNIESINICKLKCNSLGRIFF